LAAPLLLEEGEHAVVSGAPRTVFRALNAADKAAFEAGEDIVAKGIGGNPAIQVLGRQPTGYISASETLEAASRFETPELGIIEIDMLKALDYGGIVVEQPSILRSIRLTLVGPDRARALRDTARAQELLFEGTIPFEAILGFR
jgi:hypothetical protein